MATAGIKIKSKVMGFLSPKGVQQYKKEVTKKVKVAYGKALNDGVKDVKKIMRARAPIDFNVKQKTFLNTFGAYIYDTKPDKLGSVLFRQKAPWFRVHEFGGTINGKMILPINNGQKRLKPRAWKARLKQYQKDKLTFWKRVNGKLILFIKLTKGMRGLAANKKTFRAIKGLKSVKAGTVIPIAVMVNKVTLKRRYDYTRIVKDNAPKIITNYFDRYIDLNM